MYTHNISICFLVEPMSKHCCDSGVDNQWQEQANKTFPEEEEVGFLHFARFCTIYSTGLEKLFQ